MPYKDPIKRKEYHYNYSKKWCKENPDKVKLIQRKWYAGNKEEKLKKTVIANRKRYHFLKQLALEKYSGSPPKCKCCGEKTYEFLTIDHIKGGGRSHRKSLNGYTGGLYGWLVKTRKKPKQFQVLCLNCNHAKYHYGTCPHKKQESS